MYWARSLVPYGAASAWCAKIRRTADGGYVLAGNIRSQLASVFLVAKLSEIGQVEWQKTYHHIPIYREATCLEIAGDGIYVGGYAFDENRTTALVMKLRLDGSVDWTRNYRGKAYHTIPSTLLALPNGQVALAGRIETLATHHQSFLFMVLHPDGAIATARFYDYLYTSASGELARGRETAVALAPVPNGDLLIGGHVAEGDDLNKLWLVQVNPNGDLLHFTRVAGSGNSLLTAMRLIEDPAEQNPVFILSGFTTQCNPLGEFDMMLVKVALVSLPEEGTKIGVRWGNAYRYRKTSFAYDVAQVGGLDLVAAGSTPSLASGLSSSMDGVIMKVGLPDGSINAGWSRRYGHKAYPAGFYSIGPLPNHAGLFAGGYNSGFPPRVVTEPFAFGQKAWSRENLWAVSLDSQGDCPDPDEDIRCMLQGEEKPTRYVLDINPMCNQPPLPGVETPDLESVPVDTEAALADLEVRPVCG